MVSFDGCRLDGSGPIYRQIILHIKRGVVAGHVRHGDELPSRRVLSALLGVNPNTVQKAYRLLEEEGLIQSHTGSKSCMVLDDGTAETIRAELLETDAREAVKKLRHMGLSKEEVLALIEKHWEEGEEDEEA